MYVDVHTHLTHARFEKDLDQVIANAVLAGLGAMVVNGLEPKSNRQILAMTAKDQVIRPALGIYPVDAVNGSLPEDLPFPVGRFDVDAEIEFIRSQAQAGRLAAVGECGLDGHWLPPETQAEQERVFVQLMGIALDHDLPLIIHTRKLEIRSAEILRHHGARKVNFHCFGGRTKYARQWAEEDGWWFSIPANARVNQAFAKMLSILPPERILTETDAPYLPPVKGERNEPANVVGTVAFLAEIRGWDVERAKEQIWTNFQELFASS